jgi:hypothetical protein
VATVAAAVYLLIPSAVLYSITAGSVALRHDIVRGSWCSCGSMQCARWRRDAEKTLGSRKSRMIMRFFYIATVLRHVPAASSGLQ